MKTRDNQRIQFPYRSERKLNFKKNRQDIQDTALGFIVQKEIIKEQ